MEKIFDEYLLSELVRHKTNKILEQNSDKIDTEVSSAWLQLEELRRKVLESEEKNQKLTKMIELSKSIDNDISIFKPFVESEMFSDKNLAELSNSLEQSRHNLQVVGTEVSDDIVHVCSSLGTTLGGPTYDAEASLMSTLQQRMASALEDFEECRNSSRNVENLNAELSSLKLSHDQMDLSNRPDRIRTILNVPNRPEVQLIRI
jgi:hypothetical protein